MRAKRINQQILPILIMFFLLGTNAINVKAQSKILVSFEDGVPEGMSALAETLPLIQKE
jgi:hypothetical protein